MENIAQNNQLPTGMDNYFSVSSMTLVIRMMRC